MIIEVLKVTCPPELREAFIARDAEVWTPALAKQSGFISKEVWASLEDPSQVTLVIRWESWAHWKAFPAAWSKVLDAQMGDLLMLVNCQSYEVAHPTTWGRHSSFEDV